MMIFAGLGLVPVVGVLLVLLIQGNVGLGALLWFAGGLAEFAATGAFALHTQSYRIWADDGGLRQSSILGWREIRWSEIRGIEARTREVLKGRDEFLGEDERSSHRQPATTYWHFVVLLDEQGQVLDRLDSELVGQREVVQACAERTGLSVVKLPTEWRTSGFRGFWWRKQ